jgi:hypothetical protein
VARLTLLLALTLPALLSAAPVPKGVKKKADTNGTWELVEFVQNGVVQDHSRVVKLWTLDGETFRIGPTGKGSMWTLTTPSPDKPTQRRFVPSGGGAGYAAAIEADGDELRFCYAPTQTDAVEECKPATNVVFYRFKRTGDAGK